MRRDMYTSHAITHRISSRCRHVLLAYVQREQRTWQKRTVNKFIKQAKTWHLQLWQRCCAVCPRLKAMAAQSSPGDRSLGTGFTIRVTLSKTCCKSTRWMQDSMLQCFNVPLPSFSKQWVIPCSNPSCPPTPPYISHINFQKKIQNVQSIIFRIIYPKNYFNFLPQDYPNVFFVKICFDHLHFFTLYSQTSQSTSIKL